MIKLYKKLLNSIPDKLRIKSQEKEQQKVEHRFNPLTPSDNAEDCEIYFEALEWALNNKQRIKNIAISGPFGSGKSSILLTFIKQYKEKNSGFWNWLLKKTFPKCFPKLRFLNLSLATFQHFTHPSEDNNEEINSKSAEEFKPISSDGNITDGTKKGENNKTLNNNDDISDLKNDQEFQRLIELSILQQLFYHEKDYKIPDSRFKKIKSHKWSKLLLYSILFLVFLISILYLLFPVFLAHFAIIEIIVKYIQNVHIVFSILALLGLLIIIYKSSRIFIGFSINKLSFNTAEIEIDKCISKSILNHHLDEIIYFFEVTNYNVVVIEDLDRFEQTEIFTKLRELNQLINSSKKINRAIVFIYAIKENMFTDKERVKFFDFIIPVIPIINFTNSEGKLRRILSISNYKINDDLIDDLSLFIDDMRLLNNIMNEFYIHAEKITKGLDYNKLFAIIVYKNLFPKDYAILNDNRGILYKNIKNKKIYIESQIDSLNNEIEKIKERIKNGENQKLIDIKELRIIYLTKIVERIGNGFAGFNKGDKIVKISDFTNDNDFNTVINGMVNYYAYYNSANLRPDSLKFKFSDIEKEVHPELNYKQRESLIKDKNDFINLLNEIEVLRRKKEQVHKYSLRELMEAGKIIIDNGIKQTELIDILLRNGYIDENYMKYISLFHVGALTIADNYFLNNIKYNRVSPWDYKLNNIRQLIKTIDHFSFELRSLLNYQLVDELIENSEFEEKRDILFKQLANEKSYSIEFIDRYLENGFYITQFIELLCKNWPNIWSFIISKTNYTINKIEEYFILIIKHADIQDIKKIFEKDKSYISNYSNFLNIETYGSKTLDIIKALDIKFEVIDFNSPYDKIQFIYENNYYNLNIGIIRNLLQRQEIYNHELFETKNYSYLHSSKLEKIANYIDENIEEYINSVFLQLESNNSEDLEWYLKLLNNEEIDNVLKEKIIIQTNTLIEKTADIDEPEICNLLFKHSKIQPFWENILEMFDLNENTLNDYVIEYLNQQEIAKKLSKLDISLDEDENGNHIYNDLCIEIIYNKILNDESYYLLLLANPWEYFSFKAEKLSPERINILINAGKISPDIRGYNYLKENFNGKNITLLELNTIYFIKIINQINFDSDDLELITNSVLLADREKLIILNNCSVDIIIKNKECCLLIADFLVNLDDTGLRYEIIIGIIFSDYVAIDNRIKLFNKYYSDDIVFTPEMFLKFLNPEYSKITNKSKKAKIEKTIDNEQLLKKLEDLEYINSYSNKDKWLMVNHKRGKKK